jgi:hypothetical protein
MEPPETARPFSTNRWEMWFTTSFIPGASHSWLQSTPMAFRELKASAAYLTS